MADSISYLVPTQFQESIFSPIIRLKLPAQVSHFSLDLFWLFWDTSAYTGGRKMNDEKIWKGKRVLFKYLKKRYFWSQLKGSAPCFPASNRTFEVKGKDKEGLAYFKLNRQSFETKKS